MHLSKISLALRQWGAGAGFSPLDLFSSGEQGAWYDPSDINNYMGPELIVNGTFDSDTNGWIPIDATASVVGGKCVVTNTSNTWGFVATELQVTVGDSYALSIYFDTTSGYGATVAIPGLLEDGISAGQTITYSATVVADTNPLALIIGNTDEVVGHNISFDNVSIRRIGEATMFQDSAGTTPVTTDGDPVGKILDKSGRGNHASQATAAKRPLYKTSGGLHWLQFDGVDDRVSSASLDLSGTSTATLLLGLLRPNDSGYKMYAEFGPPDTTGGFYFASRSSVSGYEVGLKGSSGQTVAVTDTSAPPITDIATIELDYLQPTNATEIVIRVNGVVESTSQVGQPSAGDGPFGNLALNVGCRSDGSLPVTGNIYSMIFLGRTATTQEITDTETWVADKTGVVLP